MGAEASTIDFSDFRQGEPHAVDCMHEILRQASIHRGDTHFDKFERVAGHKRDSIAKAATEHVWPRQNSEIHELLHQLESFRPQMDKIQLSQFEAKPPASLV